MNEYTVLTKISFSSMIAKASLDKCRGHKKCHKKSKSFKINLSIIYKPQFKIIGQGKMLGRWLEDAIEEKIEREERVKAK